jgi:hypothetical protein
MAFRSLSDPLLNTYGGYIDFAIDTAYEILRLLDMIREEEAKETVHNIMSLDIEGPILLSIINELVGREIESNFKKVSKHWKINTIEWTRDKMMGVSTPVLAGGIRRDTLPPNANKFGAATNTLSEAIREHFFSQADIQYTDISQSKSQHGFFSFLRIVRDTEMPVEYGFEITNDYFYMSLSGLPYPEYVEAKSMQKLNQYLMNIPPEIMDKIVSEAINIYVHTMSVAAQLEHSLED